jgi:hypothetical protein
MALIGDITCVAVHKRCAVLLRRPQRSGSKAIAGASTALSFAQEDKPYMAVYIFFDLDF